MIIAATELAIVLFVFAITLLLAINKKWIPNTISPMAANIVAITAFIVAMLITFQLFIFPPSLPPIRTPQATIIHPTGTGFPLATVVTLRTSTPLPTQTPTSPARIAAINVETEVQSDGSVKHTAHLSVENLGYGELELFAPEKIKLGESGVVRLIITPDSALKNLLPVSVDVASANSPNYGISVNERIEIYPIMMAELEGVNFEINPPELQKRAVTSQSQATWSWSVTAKAEGNQALILTISIPVLVEEIEEQISTQLKSIPIQVLVEVTPTPTPIPTPIPTPTPTPLPVLTRIGNQFIDNSTTILLAIIPIVAGLVAFAYRNRKTGTGTNKGKTKTAQTSKK